MKKTTLGMAAGFLVLAGGGSAFAWTQYLSPTARLASQCRSEIANRVVSPATLKFVETFVDWEADKITAFKVWQVAQDAWEKDWKASLDAAKTRQEFDELGTAAEKRTAMMGKFIGAPLVLVFAKFDSQNRAGALLRSTAACAFDKDSLDLAYMGFDD